MKLKLVKTENLLECTQCGRHFKSKDMILYKRQLYNSEITVKCCPYCESYIVEPVREQIKLEKFRFFDTHNEERN